MSDPKNIDEVILAIQAERPVLTKDKKGQVGNQKTKYADLVQVNDVVLKRLNALSTIWTCRPHLENGVFGLHYSLKHVPSDTEKAGVWPLKLSENPQQMGSATTYGRRYALLAVTGIVADDEDDDGNAASGQRYAERASGRARGARETQSARNDQPTAQRAQRPAGSGPPLPGEQQSGPSQAQQRMMHALFKQVDLEDRDARLAYVSNVVGRDVASSNELTPAETTKLLDKLKRYAAQSQPPGDETDDRTQRADWNAEDDD